MSAALDLQQSRYDQEIQDIADYVLNYQIESDEAWDTARNCLMDTLGCALLALQSDDCRKYLGPLVPGTQVPFGARVPGTSFSLDPVKAAWDIGCLIHWLNYNDTWLAAEWGHPSDNLGGILAVADHLSQLRESEGKPPLLMRDVLEAMIMAHEIQGIIALENSFTGVGLAQVLLVRVASTAVVSKLMGADRDAIMAAVSQAWIDGSSLQIYRKAAYNRSRKSWESGDATSRAVRLADLAIKGEMGVPEALNARDWGFYDVAFSKKVAGKELKAEDDKVFLFPQEYGSYVMENVLFKLSYPAEFHALTATEAAVALHPQIKDRIADISKVVVCTQDSAIRMLCPQGELSDASQRALCIRYMTAVPLLFGDLTETHYSDNFHAQHAEIDQLRDKIEIVEIEQYCDDYYDPEKRAIANSVQVFFVDGSCTEELVVQYPVGHRFRRDEGIPLLEEKFKASLQKTFSQPRCQTILELCKDQVELEQMPVHKFMDLFVI